MCTRVRSVGCCFFKIDAVSTNRFLPLPFAYPSSARGAAVPVSSSAILRRVRTEGDAFPCHDPLTTAGVMACRVIVTDFTQEVISKRKRESHCKEKKESSCVLRWPLCWYCVSVTAHHHHSKLEVRRLRIRAELLHNLVGVRHLQRLHHSWVHHRRRRRSTTTGSSGDACRPGRICMRLCRPSLLLSTTTCDSGRRRRRRPPRGRRSDAPALSSLGKHLQHLRRQHTLLRVAHRQTHVVGVVVHDHQRRTHGNDVLHDVGWGRSHCVVREGAVQLSRLLSNDGVVLVARSTRR
jgi:hypothetical protein